MEIPSEIERRRQTFGARIRGLRAAEGLSGPKLADRSGIAQSQISRIERGQITPHEAAISALLDALKVSASEREDVLDELRAMRAEYASWQLLTEPGGGGRRQRELADIEAQATHVRDFQPGMVSGFLQTAAYAKAVFSCWPHAHDASRIPDAVQGRMERQAVLFDDDRRFQFVIMEQALWLTVAELKVMTAQFDRIGQLADLPNVEIRIVPLGTPIDCCPLTPFVMLDDEMVIVDFAASALNLRGTQEVASHTALFERVRSVALTTKETKPWLDSHSRRYAKTIRSNG